MKLLFLLPAVPEPADAGAKIRNLGLLRVASGEHVVDAVAFGEAGGAQRLGRLVRRAWVVPPPAARGAPRRLRAMATSPWPDVAERFWSPAFVRQLHRALGRERYDVVQAEGIEMAGYLRLVAPAGGGPRCVYDAHNAEFLLQRRACEASLGARRPGALASAIYSRLQWQRLERFEGDTVARSQLSLAVSYHDANQLTALGGPRATVRVVPNCVDVQAYAFRQPAACGRPSVLFLGKLDYRPNGDAVAWLLGQVLPRLFRQRADARLFVVGAKPPPWLVRAGQHDNRVAVVGPVADERPYLERCSALVLPLRVGGGSRLKALVALASGLPVVATGLGMEGIDAQADVHYLRADSAETMAAALDRVLGDVALRQRLASAGRQLVAGRYDWPALARALQAAYQDLGATG